MDEVIYEYQRKQVDLLCQLSELAAEANFEIFVKNETVDDPVSLLDAIMAIRGMSEAPEFKEKLVGAEATLVGSYRKSQESQQEIKSMKESG